MQNCVTQEVKINTSKYVSGFSQVAGEKDEMTKDEKHSHTDSERISFSNLESK